MASCTQIENILQGFIDDELGDSDRVILEQHVEECSACRARMRRQKRASARLFEAFAGGRLTRDLSRPVLEHLPEMDFPPIDVVGLNERAKHPAKWREKMVRLTPLAAAALLVILAGVISENWPTRGRAVDPIGVVTWAQGTTTTIAAESEKRTDAPLEHLIAAGDRVETGQESKMMVTLAGPTEIRMDSETRVLIQDDRRIRMEQGQALFHVANQGDRYFRVQTPVGDVTVFGTTFNVHVTPGATTVAVEEGEVQVDYRNEFAQIVAGQVVQVAADRARLEPFDTDVREFTRWASVVQADERADSLFRARVQARSGESEVLAHSVYYHDTNDRKLKAITLNWKADEALWGHCSYDVYVFAALTNKKESLYRGRISGDTFADKSRSSFEIPDVASWKLNSTQIFVRVVPDYSSGTREVEFTDAKFTVGL